MQPCAHDHQVPASAAPLLLHALPPLPRCAFPASTLPHGVSVRALEQQRPELSYFMEAADPYTGPALPGCTQGAWAAASSQAAAHAPTEREKGRKRKLRCMGRHAARHAAYRSVPLQPAPWQSGKGNVSGRMSTCVEKMYGAMPTPCLKWTSANHARQPWSGMGISAM